MRFLAAKFAGAAGYGIVSCRNKLFADDACRRNKYQSFRAVPAEERPLIRAPCALDGKEEVEKDTRERG